MKASKFLFILLGIFLSATGSSVEGGRIPIKELMEGPRTLISRPVVQEVVLFPKISSKGWRTKRTANEFSSIPIKQHPRSSILLPIANQFGSLVCTQRNLNWKVVDMRKPVVRSGRLNCGIQSSKMRYDKNSTKHALDSDGNSAKIKIDLLKHHPEAIPTLSNIWSKMLGKWSPNVKSEEVEIWLHEWLNDSIPLSYISLDGSTPVGMCSLQLNDGIRPDLMPWLGDLCIDQAYQKRGIGKLLVNATQKKAKELGFDKLYLFAPDPTIPSYYERLGWRKIGLDRYNGHPVTVMEVQL